MSVTIDGKDADDISVGGTPKSYEVLKESGSRTGLIELTIPAGVEVYSFTFG